MSDPLQSADNAAENIVNKTSDLVNAQINAIEQKARRNKLIFWLIIIGLVIAAVVAFYFIHKEQSALHARIANDEKIISNMQDSVKMRDKHIEQIGKDMSKQDAIIRESKDSIVKAYAILNQLHIIQINQNQQHEKDNAAISRLSLNDKIKLLTGSKH